MLYFHMYMYMEVRAVMGYPNEATCTCTYKCVYMCIKHYKEGRRKKEKKGAQTTRQYNTYTYAV